MNPLEETISIPVNGKPRDMTIEDAVETRDAINHAICVRSGKLSVNTILTEVCAEFEISKAAIMSDRKTPRVAFPRQVAMYFLRQLTGKPFDKIGEDFHRQNGKPRDHGTIIYAWQIVEERKQGRDEQAAQIARVEEKLKRSFTKR